MLVGMVVILSFGSVSSAGTLESIVCATAKHEGRKGRRAEWRLGGRKEGSTDIPQTNTHHIHRFFNFNT